MITPAEKPPYRVPLMEEIRKIPWNGLTVASTFSGAGGSCTGYRMAGFKVVWANEFVPIAQESYKANAAEDCILDPRDIRKIEAKEILKATGLKQGELDLFDGSPPCQAFSTAGKREKGWGKGKTYEHGAVQCNEQLFDDYIRLLRGLMPRTFVAENVSGLVKGKAKGFFLEILKELKASGYRVSCRVLDAQWLGVPQMRQRTIFVGVREDLGLDPVHPKPFSYRYSVRDALPHLCGALHENGGFTKTDCIESPSPTVTATQCRMTAEESQIIHDESGQWSEGNITERPAPTVRAGRSGSLQVQSGAFPKKYSDADKPSPASDDGRTTEIREVPQVIHDTGNFAKNKPIADQPCPASNSGTGALNSTHYLVAGEGEGDTKTGRRPDGVTRRKFTIDEVKRICGFPDDFILKGSYSQQWERLGNSVPPVMMSHIASAIRDQILLIQQKTPA